MHNSTHTPNPSLYIANPSSLFLFINSHTMRMIDMGNQRGPLYIIDTSTSVDCTKDVRFRRSFRSLVECMVLPCCGFQPTTLDSSDFSDETDSTTTTTTTVTVTFFGHRKGRVSFCIQEDSKAHPLLLLEFAIPTAYLAKEMQHGLLRVALECNRVRAQDPARSGPGNTGTLFNVPVWTMYCNGRKVGYAVKRSMSESDAAIFKMMRSVSVGTGVLPKSGGSCEGDLMYLRASFERVVGSIDSESFHMINPVGSTGQELSIFMLRS